MKAQPAWKVMEIAAKKLKLRSCFDFSPWGIGKWRRKKKSPQIMCHGFNASPRFWMANCWVTFHSNYVIAQVEYTGSVIKEQTKVTAQCMRILRAWRLTPERMTAMTNFVLEEFKKITSTRKLLSRFRLLLCRTQAGKLLSSMTARLINGAEQINETSQHCADLLEDYITAQKPDFGTRAKAK